MSDRQVVGELPPIVVGREGVTQRQVSLIRNKIVEMTRAYNTVAALVSVGLRLLSGERVAPGSKLPGLVVHNFLTTDPEEVSHGLGRYPIGYIVIRRFPIGHVADGSPADWNPLTAYLQTDTVGLQCTVLFF